MTARYTVQEFLLTYGSWQSMMQRCVYKGQRKDSRFYKERDVKVFRRWLRFQNFMADVGPRPGKEFSLDRFPDKNGDYVPGNVRWATAKEQAANTRSAVILTLGEEAYPIAEWARRTGIGRATIQARLKAGWAVHDALTTEAGDRHPKSFFDGRDMGKKLSRGQVLGLIEEARQGATATALGKKYGVSTPAVCYIAKQFGIRFKKGRPKR